MVTFDHPDARKLELINVVMSCCSFAGAAFIIFGFFSLPNLRTFAFRLVLCVAFSDLFYSLGNFLGDAGGNPDTHVGASTGLCTFQALLISYFGLASMLWSCSIAFTLHMAFLRGDEHFHPPVVETKMKYYHLICWGYPIPVTFLPFITHSYGDTGGWCWITNNDLASTLWRFFQFYIVLWIVITYCAWVYFQVYRKLTNSLTDQRTVPKQVSHIRFYPLVLVICWIWGTINTVYTSFHEDSPGLLWMNALHIFFASALGAVNAFVYGLTPIVQHELGKRFTPCVGEPGATGDQSAAAQTELEEHDVT